ncbi:MAG: PIG-L deacetylase family protein [Armatimonadota bacterium]
MTAETRGPLSVVAVGAHMDDCYLGMGGAAIRAARSGHRVTLVQAVSSYGAWPTVAGREAEIKPVLQQLAGRAGVSVISLGHDYQRLENGVALVDQLSCVLAELKPDVLFCHHPVDTNQDHVALGQATPVAAMHGACFVGPGFHVPDEIYRFTTGTQTLEFEPNTYLDVGASIADVLEILGAIDAIYAKESGESPVRITVAGPDLDQRTISLTAHALDKFALCVTYGFRCGVGYAEAFASYPSRPPGPNLLDRL